MALRGRTTKQRVQDFANNTVQRAQNFAHTAANAPATFYNLLKDKAKDMGHAAANLPDDIWDKYVRMQYKRDLLTESKIYIEKYMMGNLEPSELAQIMAEDDYLRYTISDICRAKLEPTDLNIERNDKYIDVGAGIKTFWTEIRVPLPSEIETARDLRNIYFGIEAGRAANGTQSKSVSDSEQNSDEENKPKKKSFRERISDGRRALAQKAIDKLTPFAESADKEEEIKTNETDMNESLLDKLQAMGLDSESAAAMYNSIMQRKAAQNLENLTMAVEASRDVHLHPDQRVNALTSTGVSEEDAKRLVQDGTNKTFAKQVEEYETQKGNIHYDQSQEEINADNELFSQEDEAAAGIDSEESPIYQEPYKSGYSAEELSRSVNDELTALFDQISAHVNRDRAAYKKDYDQEPKQNVRQEQSNTQEQSAGIDKEKPIRKDYISGEFEGKSVQFKGSWYKHKFTEEEVHKLLAGESVTFTYTTSSNQEKEISGKLEWRKFDGREYLGFKPNSSKKNTMTTETTEELKQSDNSLFNAQDEVFAMGNTENQLFTSTDMSADIAAYENMKASGEIGDEPACYAENEDDVYLTENDISGIQNEELPFSK